MKVITVPDLHGKDDWTKINPKNYDKIIFLGDYVDAPYRKATDIAKADRVYSRPLIHPEHGRTDVEILYNLTKIIELKDTYPEKVVLLLGNHDVPYIYHIKNKTLQRMMMSQGYRYSMENELAELFNKNINKFQIAYRIKDVIWSHAGITPQAYNTYFKNKLNNNFDLLVDELNRWFILNEPELFYISTKRGGREFCGSILWADISEWLDYKYNFTFTQIVGHSKVNKISYLYDDKQITDKVLSKKSNVIFTDCLDTEISFYETEL